MKGSKVRKRVKRSKDKQTRDEEWEVVRRWMCRSTKRK